jgi:hypothetical protein
MRLTPAARPAPHASCQADPRCGHPACFAARLGRLAGHDQDVRTLLACGRHLTDIVQALTAEAGPAGGTVTVLAVDPAAWHLTDPVTSPPGQIPASVPFDVVRIERRRAVTHPDSARYRPWPFHCGRTPDTPRINLRPEPSRMVAGRPNLTVPVCRVRPCP